MSHTATPPLEELTILLGAGAYWADCREQDDPRDPVTELRDIAREAHEMIENLPPVYHAAPALLAALHYLLEQTVDQDLTHGIELTEGEQDARAQALAAIASVTV